MTVGRIKAATLSMSLIVLFVFMVGCGNGRQDAVPLTDQAAEMTEKSNTSDTSDTTEKVDSSDTKVSADEEDTHDQSEDRPDKDESDDQDEIADHYSENEYLGHKFKDGITMPVIETKEYNLPDSEGLSFINDLEVGINLGNTFDAYNDGNVSDEMSIEEYWQGVHTTKEHIQKIHEYGFKTIRIPVSWHNHVDEDLNISKNWLDRVSEVVGYALDEDMYVIIDIHHDNHPEANGIYPDSANMEQSRRYIERIWTQVGTRFADTDDHVIFEAMNEPRLVGHEDEWNFNSASKDCIESVKCINELNQLFVDTIRGLGGNNKTRYLMCPGYCASVDGALNPWFELPKDSSGYDDRIILSIHAYTPYNFALEYPGIKNFDIDDKSSTSDIDTFMSKLYTEYIYKGIPVLIGEFGARNKSDNLQDRVNYTAYFTAKARSRGISVVWWDNNDFAGSGELFGIFDRKNPENSTFEIIAALKKYSEKR